MIRVLCVEDEKIVAELMKNRFQRIGMQVEVIHRWKEACQRLQQTPKPEIISLDLILPDCALSPLQQVAEIRRLSPESLLIVVSGVADAEALAPGADAYIPKGPTSTSASFYKTILDQVSKRDGYESDLPVIQEAVNRFA